MKSFVHDSLLGCCCSATQVLIVWFGSFVAGSFFSQFQQWINNPASAVNIIGTAVPLTAIFFMSYMVLNVGREHPGRRPSPFPPSLSLSGMLAQSSKFVLCIKHARKRGNRALAECQSGLQSNVVPPRPTLQQ